MTLEARIQALVQAIGADIKTLLARPVGTSSWTTVNKTADQTKSSTAAIALDTHLQFPMLANTKYAIRGMILFDTTANADFKWRHVGPAAPTLVRFARQTFIPSGANPVTAVDTAFSAADIALTGTGTNGGFVQFTAIVHTAAAAGTFGFQWAQNASDAGNTIVRAGSFIEYMTI